MDINIWVEKYRPNSLKDLILSDENREIFEKYLEHKSIPNIIFFGQPGTGKTSTALVLLKELNPTLLRLCGSDDRGIDVIRNQIKSFIQVKAFDGKQKIVFYDEGEYLTSPAMAALKEITERYQKFVSFLFCTNHLFRFSDAIRSRCTSFEFQRPLHEDIINFYKKVLTAEKIDFKAEDLERVYKTCSGDLRQSLIHLQKYSITGELKLSDESFEEVFALLKSGKIRELKQYFANHSVDWDSLYRHLYERTENPKKLVVLSKYYYQHELVVDKEINFMGFISDYLDK